MQNIEFKAELRSHEAAAVQCTVLGGQHMATLRQRDTFYRLADGRLKKRETPQEATVWIYYHRPDVIRPRMCNYTILNDEQARRRWGTRSLTPWVAVEKTRDLWLIRGTRVHLDRVDRLGRFVEFEAIVSKDFDVEACHRAIGRMRTAFAPVMGEPISVSYGDLVADLAESEATE